MKELKALLLVYFVGLFLNGLVIYQFFKELIFLVAVDLVKLKDELVFGGMGDFFKFLFSSIVVFSMLWAFYFLMYVLFIFFNKSITRKKSTIFLLFLFVNFGISVLNFIGIIPILLRHLCNFLSLSQILNLQEVTLKLILPGSHLLNLYLCLLSFCLMIDFLFAVLLFLENKNLIAIFLKFPVRIYYITCLVIFIMFVIPPDPLSHIVVIFNCLLLAEIKLFLLCVDFSFHQACKSRVGP